MHKPKPDITHISPFKLIKLMYPVPERKKLEPERTQINPPTTTHVVNALDKNVTDAFVNCFLIDQDKIFVFTRYHILLFDDNLKKLHEQKIQQAIHKEISWMSSIEPSRADHDKYILLCRMNNKMGKCPFTEEFRGKKPQQLY